MDPSTDDIDLKDRWNGFGDIRKRRSINESLDQETLLILLIKNTHFFGRSNRWIINLETTISNARKNAQKIFCKITVGIEGCSYIYIYIVHRKWSRDMKYVAVSLNNAQYCPYSTACRSKIHGCVHHRRSRELSLIIVVVVVVFSRHWFAWFIIIMVAAFEILGDRCCRTCRSLLCSNDHRWFFDRVSIPNRVRSRRFRFFTSHYRTKI